MKYILFILGTTTVTLSIMLNIRLAQMAEDCRVDAHLVEVLQKRVFFLTFNK